MNKKVAQCYVVKYWMKARTLSVSILLNAYDYLRFSSPSMKCNNPPSQHTLCLTPHQSTGTQHNVFYQIPFTMFDAEFYRDSVAVEYSPFSA